MSSRVASLTFQFTAIACLFVFANTAQAQNTPGSTGVRLAKLQVPTYPPLARQARIGGDVTIQVQVRRDGSVASAEVESGHPMLNPAALASAQNSTFELPECTEELTSFSLTYTFGFNNLSSDCSLKRLRSAKCFYLWRCGVWRANDDMPSPSVTQFEGHITILTGNVCLETQTSTLLP